MYFFKYILLKTKNYKECPGQEVNDKFSRESNNMYQCGKQFIVNSRSFTCFAPQIKEIVFYRVVLMKKIQVDAYEKQKNQYPGNMCQ